MMPTSEEVERSLVRRSVSLSGGRRIIAALLASAALISHRASAEDPSASNVPSAESKRVLNGILAVAAGSPWELSRQSVAAAFEVPVDVLAPYAGDGTIDNFGGYAASADSRVPFYLGMAFQDTAHRTLSFALSLVNESPRPLDKPLPFCLDALMTKSRLQDLGWRFAKLSQSPHHIQAFLIFVQESAKRRATLTLTYAAAHEGLEPGDCVDRVSIEPFRVGS